MLKTFSALLFVVVTWSNFAQAERTSSTIVLEKGDFGRHTLDFYPENCVQAYQVRLKVLTGAAHIARYFVRFEDGGEQFVPVVRMRIRSRGIEPNTPWIKLNNSDSVQGRCVKEVIVVGRSLIFPLIREEATVQVELKNSEY